LLSRVKQGGQLAVQERDLVRRALADQSTPEDKHTLIHILWKARDAQSGTLIWARVADEDEMVRRIALQALTELTPSAEVFNLALRMAEEPSKYVRMVAATAIGTLGALLPQRTAEAARFLLENFERRQATADAEWELYYEGLLDLVQVPQDKRPLATRDLRMADVQPEVIATARSLTARP
jgi:HEAT repeat protein